MRHHDRSGSVARVPSEYRRGGDRAARVVRRAAACPTRHDPGRDGLSSRHFDFETSSFDDRVGDDRVPVPSAFDEGEDLHGDGLLPTLSEDTEDTEDTENSPRLDLPVDLNPADLEALALREWDMYWEDLHARTRIGLLESRRGGSGFRNNRTHSHRVLIAGPWGRGYASSSIAPDALSFQAERSRARRASPSARGAGFFAQRENRETVQETTSQTHGAKTSCGVSRKTLDGIPEVTYGGSGAAGGGGHLCDDVSTKNSGKNHHDGLGDECAVCLADFHKGERLAKLPACRHLFHRKCVTRWLEQSEECPKCRAVVSSVTSVGSSPDYLPTELVSEQERSDAAAADEAWKWTGTANLDLDQGTIFAPSPRRLATLLMS